MLVGLTRVRNESLIIADTIKHYLERCEHIILYDDCSVDNTIKVAKTAGGGDITIVRGNDWRNNRVMENTRHRGILLDRAKLLGADWCLCFDADERLVGELPPLSAAGYTFRLFDGYLTPGYQQEYMDGDLAKLPRMWGPEFRDIVMLFRTDCAAYDRPGQREPTMTEPADFSKMHVKHYGKCLSIEHWEATCMYYARHYPEPYRSKWASRIGKAIHTVSDFGRELYTWDELMRHRFKVWRRI